MTTLKGIVSAFLSTRRLRNLSPNTITFYSQHLNKFLEFMESHSPDVSLEQIDHIILGAYVSGLKENHSPLGVNHHIKVQKILLVMDDYSRYILAWRLCRAMMAEDAKKTLDMAIEWTGVEHIHVVHRPRLLSWVLAKWNQLGVILITITVA